MSEMASGGVCCTELLIDHVKMHPILYDLKNADYKNMRKKDQVWDDIGAQMEMSAYDLKKKWKNLRDTYVKYLRSIKTTTGRRAKKMRPWQWSAQMEFFRHYFTFASTVPTLAKETSLNSVNRDTDGDLQDEIFYTQQSAFKGINEPSTSSSTSQRPTDNVPEAQKSLLAVAPKRVRKQSEDSSDVDTIGDFLANEPENSMTATEHLMMGLAKTIDTFLPKRQASCKMLVAQVVLQNELEHSTEKKD